MYKIHALDSYIGQVYQLHLDTDGKRPLYPVFSGTLEDCEAWVSLAEALS